MHTSRQDPQDKAFGSAASKDQEFVEQLEDEGVEEDDLPDQVTPTPRAAGKAEPTN